MILADIIIILLVGGFLSWGIGKGNETAGRWVALLAVIVSFVLAVSLWITHPVALDLPTENGGSWLVDFQKEWIPSLGVSFHFAIDGLSLIMTVLTLFVGGLSVLASWKSVKKRVGFYHFNLLWLLAGILGVFFSMDLLLFYFFWEIMLIPMFFILAIWGFENKRYASLKFFIFTQLSGLLMLIAILGLYFVHGSQTGSYSFDYFTLLGTPISRTLGFWLMCGFLIAFLTKLPAVPFHSWLPDAYVQSPTAGVVILAGLMTKTAAYGLLRFVLPLFPEGVKMIAPLMIILGVVSILYGAKLAYAQTDFKRLVAFSSLSHMGFILIGIFSFTTLAFQGAVFEMVTHAISISALFIVAGVLQERTGTREMDLMGGFWERMPRMGGITMVFVLATLGLPGLGNFIAEFLVLSGTFQASALWGVLAALGLVGSMIYSLVLLQRVFHGPENPTIVEKKWQLNDFSAREILVMTCLIVVIVWLGFFPQKVINTVQPFVQELTEHQDVGMLEEDTPSILDFQNLFQPDYNNLTNMDQSASTEPLFSLEISFADMKSEGGAAC